ncbi:MAG: PKD domain-containing protein [Chloroflexi bacterium]|nr:PKD domain-containing protein [Chloroflexota bacterium]
MNRLALILAVLLIGTAACAPAAPDPTATLPATEMPIASATPEPTLSPTRRATLPPEPTRTNTFTPSATSTLRPTRTLVPSATRTYTATSTFTPSLTPSDTATFTPTLTPSASPTISFTPEPNTAAEQQTALALLPFGGQFGYVARGLAVGFIDLTRGHPESWEWDFGDGGTSTWRSPNHTYSAPGLYLVRLTVRGDAQVSRVVRVIKVNPRECVLSPKGRVRLHAQPSGSAQTLYFLIGEHFPKATTALLDAGGVLWYHVEFSTNGWVRASEMNVIEGLCPRP